MNQSRRLLVIQAVRTLLSLLIALPVSLAAQSSGNCANPFQAAGSPGRELAMNLRAGDITIVGTDGPLIRVSCSAGKDNPENHEVKISFAADHLTIRGGPDREMHFRIEIPRATNLRIRCSAGNLSVSGISGDKDVELNAGNLTIEVGNAANYRHAEASVLAGNLRASAFGVEHGGLFRNFKRDNTAGRYRLRAQLYAGDLTLR